MVFDKDEEIVLLFKLPRKKEFIIEGTVQRVSRSKGTYSYGVKFKPMSIIKKIRLRALIPVLVNAGKTG